MKPLIVYKAGDDYFGQEVAWRKSGSGTYREISGIGIPQTRPEIEKFAADNGFAIEWRVPAEEVPERPEPSVPRG